MEVSNVNDPPNQVTSTPLTGAVKLFLYTYDVDAFDEDGDTPTYSLTIAPDGMTIDSSTGLIQWTPDETQVGSHTIEILISDGNGGTFPYSYILTVSATNASPQITSTPVAAATQDQPYTYDVEATDSDGDPITFRLDAAPAGMSIDAATGLIQWTPTNAQVGNGLGNQVTVTAMDNKGAADSQEFTIAVANVNDPPQPPLPPATTPKIAAGALYTYQVQAVDIDGDPLTYSLEVAPDGMTINSSTGLIEWTPAASDLGDHTVRVIITDPSGVSVPFEFTLSVVETIDAIPPRISHIVINPLTLNLGQSATITIDAVDNEGVSSYELEVDGVGVALVGNTATYTPVGVGVHTVIATVTDAFGNTDTETAKFGVRDSSDTTPPQVVITSPAADAEITAPTPIVGTVNDANLVAYTLEYSEKGKGEYTEFYRGCNNVNNGTLGTIDPTMLVNGLYDIKFSAIDVNGAVNSVELTCRVTGDLKVGNFSVTFKDLEIPVAGIPITIYRTYDSRVRGKQGDFAYGWSIDIKTTKVEENREMGEGWYSDHSGGLIPRYYLLPDGAHYVTITLPDGQTLEFDCKFLPESQVLYPIEWIDSAVYTPRPGTNGSLVALDDDPMYFDGSEILNWDFEIYNPDRYQLTTLDGTVYIIDQNEGLLKVTDSNGNSLEVSYGGIIHSSGKSITFTRDAQGRITKITDPMGNILSYECDAKGDLVAFTDQGNNTSHYTYNSNHGLVDIIDPRGVKAVRNEYDYDGHLVAHIDAEGNRIEYDHNLDSRQEVVSDRLGNITVFEYDTKGKVIRKADPLGHAISYTYDARGNKLSETDPLGHTTSFTYDAKGSLLTKTDPLGNTATFTYNAQNKVLSTTDHLGRATVNTYDGKGNLLTTTDPLGNTTTYTYDTPGNLTSKRDALGNVTSYQYNSFGNMTRQIDPLGNITTFTYDENGNQLTQSITRTTPSGTETVTTVNEYDSKNRLVRIIDPYRKSTVTEYNPLGKKSALIDKNGNRTEYEYDTRGNLIKTIYPDGANETITYDAEGRKTSSTDRAGRITRFVYDAAARLIQTLYADGTSTANGYDAAGMVITQTDARGNSASLTYDAVGHRTSVTDALGNTTAYTYDANGNQVSMTDDNGHTTTYEYDENNHLTKTTFPDGTFTEITYDALGQKITETDQAGLTTGFAYDALGQLSSVTDAYGQVTRYAYDEMGNKITQTDARGQITGWEYDKLGNVIKKTLPLGMSESIVYDSAGNMISKTDFNGNTITYAYDCNNRPVLKSYPDGSSVSFTYTPTGQKASITDARGTTTYSYDLRDRLLQRIDPDGTAVTYTYDESGNRTSVTVPSGTTTCTFDALNRLATVTDPHGGVTAYAYDPVGNRSGVIYPNGTTAVYTYDTLNRLILLENKRDDNSIISSYLYTLGPAGNRIRVVEHTGTVDYTYDNLYRLTEERINDPAHGSRTIFYSYDQAGNRLSKVDSVDGTTNYTYDENDRLLTENSAVYAYDNNGNTLGKNDGTNASAYVYDYENRLIQAQTPASLITYGYDADGIRVTSSANGTTTYYLVDHNRDYAQVLEERDAASVLTASYIYGDDLISMTRGSVESFYHYDGNGNTRQLTGSSENVTDTYTYDAFGNIVDRTGVTENNYLYAGEQYDFNIGFYYLRSRYLNVQTGRFLTPDTYPADIFDPATLHRYLYVANNPVNYVDPAGQQFGTISGLMVSVSIGQIINSIVMSTLIPALFILTGIELFWRPGFALRNMALDAMASGQLGPDGWEAAMRMYESGAKLIQLGSFFIQQCNEIWSICQLGLGIKDLAKAVLNAPRTTTIAVEVWEYSRFSMSVEMTGTSLLMQVSQVNIRIVRTMVGSFVNWAKTIEKAEKLFFRVLHLIEKQTV